MPEVTVTAAEVAERLAWPPLALQMGESRLGPGDSARPRLPGPQLTVLAERGGGLPGGTRRGQRLAHGHTSGWAGLPVGSLGRAAPGRVLVHG